MPWSSVALFAAFTIAWLLLLGCRKIYIRIRTPQHLTWHRDAARYYDKDSADSRAQAQIGWFWLVLSWHLDPPEGGVVSNTGKRPSQARRKPFLRTLKTFYTLGTICTLMAFTAVPFYLALMLYQAVRSNPEETSQIVAIQSSSPSGLLIPGLTVPLRDWIPLFLAGLVAIAWHEAGHAITAILYASSSSAKNVSYAY